MSHVAHKKRTGTRTRTKGLSAPLSLETQDDTSVCTLQSHPAEKLTSTRQTHTTSLVGERVMRSLSSSGGAVYSCSYS